MKKIKGNNFLKEKRRVEEDEIILPLSQDSLYSCL